MRHKWSIEGGWESGESCCLGISWDTESSDPEGKFLPLHFQPLVFR